MKNNTILLILNPKTPKKSRGGYSHISNLKSIAVIAMMLLFLGVGNAWGDKLCQSSYTGTIGALGSKTVYVSVGTIGTNMYRIVFESDFAMTGSLTYVNTSYNNNLCLDNATKTILDGGKTIYFDMPSTSAPTFKNSIQVSYGGGGYTLSGTAVNSVDWSQTTGECSALSGNDCTGWSTEASTGGASFTKGYVYELGSDESGNVSISVKFLDDPTGASTAELYMLNESGGELGGFTAMTWSSGTKTASHTLTGQSGTIYFKVRVPYTGNVFVTKKFSVTVGTTCAIGGTTGGGEEDDEDCEDPDVTTIWFLNTNGWSDSYTYAYMWKGGTENAQYPGEVMTPTSIFNKDSKKLYYVTFDKDTYSKVKFNCNSNNDGCYTSDLDIQANRCYNFASGWVNVPSAVHVATDVNSYSISADPMSFICNSLDYEARVTFPTTGNHAFKIVVTDGNNYWYGCTPGSTPTESFSNYAFSTSGGNMPFTADVAGDYYFKFNYATQTVSVTYPPYMTSASLYSKTANTAVLNVASTRGTKYKVTNSDGSVEYTVSNGGAPTDGKITVTGLSANTQYSFKVYALDDNDTESANYSSVSSFYTLANMGSASFSSSTCNSITLNVSSTGGVKYTVKSTDGATTYLDEGTPSDGKITVSGLSVGTAYDFYVYAVNSADELSTNYASVSSVSTTSAPATPSSISINTRTYNSITLNVTSANSTKFEYSTNAGENWKTINTTGTIEITELSSESTALSPNTSYTFLIRGKNDCGDVSVGNTQFTAKTTPQITSASLYSKTHNSVVLSVSSNGGATYKVTNTAGNVVYTVSNSGAPTDGKITVTGLSDFTTYTFRVYAMSSDGTPIQSSNYVDVSSVRTYSAGPASAPSHTSPSCEVYGIYGTQHTNKGMTHGAWGAASSAETVTVDSKSMIHVNTHQASYFGMEYGTKSSDVVDVSGYTKMHLEIWTPASYTFNVCLIYGDGTEATKTSITTNAGSWTSYEYSLSSWETTYQIKFDNINYSEDVEIWFAQAYFYKTDAPCTAPSNPTTSECQTIALYGTQYTAKGWRYGAWHDGIGSGADDTQAGQTMFKVATDGANYFGLEYGTWSSDVVDVHHLEKFHIDVWTPTAQTFNICLIYNNGTEYGKKQVTTSAALWTSIEIDLSSSLTDTYQIKFDGVSTTAFNMWVANAYFYTDDVCESEKCHGSGRAGSGLTINGATVFDSGESYWTKAYMKNDKLHIDAKFIPASNAAAAAYVQFIKSDGGVLEFAMTNKTDSFSVDIIPSNVTEAYRYDGIARYSVKFAISGGSRQTDYHYYDFTNSECAPDYFDIYHYDDATGSQRTSYAGGTILQPIRYFRHFEHTDWCAITFPFSVSKVVVDEGGKEYDLYPRFNNGSSDVEGYYWLKTLSGEVAISEFKDSWEELKVLSPGSSDSEIAANVKPAKNTPYIIAFPDGGYYSANWVIFYGAACQTISSSFAGTSSITLSSEDYDYNKVQFVGNNTMTESSELTNIYMLEEGEDYFSRRESATVPAFEAYVKGTSEIQKSYVALRYRGGSSTPETPTDIDALPTTECRGAIYNLSGMQMGTFADRNAMEEVLNSLRAGVYIVHIGKEVNKVIVH